MLLITNVKPTLCVIGRPRVRELVAELRAEWEELDTRIEAIDEELAAEAQDNDACRRLMEIPGIGPQTATALVSAIGNGQALDRGRDVAAWLGLTPREEWTGGRQRLGGISKRGNGYLRTLLVHGARSSLETLSERPDALGAWLRRLLASKPERKVVIVALAARLARIAWALLSGEKRFQPPGRPAARRRSTHPRLVCKPESMEERSHRRLGNLSARMALRGRNRYEDQGARNPSWYRNPRVPLRGRIYSRRPIYPVETAPHLQTRGRTIYSDEPWSGQASGGARAPVGAPVRPWDSRTNATGNAASRPRCLETVNHHRCR